MFLNHPMSDQFLFESTFSESVHNVSKVTLNDMAKLGQCLTTAKESKSLNHVQNAWGVCYRYFVCLHPWCSCYAPTVIQYWCTDAIQWKQQNVMMAFTYILSNDCNSAYETCHVVYINHYLYCSRNFLLSSKLKCLHHVCSAIFNDCLCH